MTDTDDQGSTTDTSADSQTEAPVTSGTDPTQTEHPAGAEQARENEEMESPA